MKRIVSAIKRCRCSIGLFYSKPILSECFLRFVEYIRHYFLLLLVSETTKEVTCYNTLSTQKSRGSYLAKLIVIQSVFKCSDTTTNCTNLLRIPSFLFCYSFGFFVFEMTSDLEEFIDKICELDSKAIVPKLQKNGISSFQALVRRLSKAPKDAPTTTTTTTTTAPTPSPATPDPSTPTTDPDTASTTTTTKDTASDPVPAPEPTTKTGMSILAFIFLFFSLLFASL
jgi:hypothetical protein